MSRVGKYPVAIPSGVEASLTDALFTAKGKNGEQAVSILENVKVVIENDSVIVTPNNMKKRTRQMWGTMRALINNAVIGANSGFTKKLEINGVGYRAQIQGTKLKLNLGYSHEVIFTIPSDLKIVMEGDRGNIISISGASKQRVGQVASEIRAYRPPEPYKGKGLKYVDERIVRKEGKKK